MTTRLRHHSSCQCKVVRDESTNCLYFVSYATQVIKAEPQEDGTYNVYCSGTYSPTTARQITYFLREFFPELTLQDMKRVSSNSSVYNVQWSTECCNAQLSSDVPSYKWR